jgi:hypothetical protein
VICTKRQPKFVRSRGDNFHFRPFPSGVTESRSHGPSLTWSHFLFEKEEVCWSGGVNVPWISRDIKLCAQKVKLCAQKVEPAVRDRGPRSLSGALTGRIMGKSSGRLELTD